MYEAEKERKIQTIKKIKKKLKIEDNNTEPDDSFLDLSEEEADNYSFKSDRKIFTF